jgi:hypothetical protein
MAHAITSRSACSTGDQCWRRPAQRGLPTVDNSRLPVIAVNVIVSLVAVAIKLLHDRRSRRAST